VNQPTEHETQMALEQRSRELFDERVAHLDAGTQSRLNQARQSALDIARGKSRPMNGSRWLLPVGSAAALALVAVTTVQIMRPSSELPAIESSSSMASTMDDVEILTSTDELEMLQNMDFYAWLETQQGDVAHAAPGEPG
jgi:hypothetical protein